MRVEFGKAQKRCLIDERIARGERIALRRIAENERVGREVGKITGERESKIGSVAVERSERFAQRGAAHA